MMDQVDQPVPVPSDPFNGSFGQLASTKEDSDEDFGPETDVDAVDDVLVSPLQSNNPFASEPWKDNLIEYSRQETRDLRDALNGDAFGLVDKHMKSAGDAFGVVDKQIKSAGDAFGLLDNQIKSTEANPFDDVGMLNTAPVLENGASDLYKDLVKGSQDIEKASDLLHSGNDFIVAHNGTDFELSPANPIIDGVFDNAKPLLGAAFGSDTAFDDAKHILNTAFDNTKPVLDFAFDNTKPVAEDLHNSIKSVPEEDDYGSHLDPFAASPVSSIEYRPKDAVGVVEEVVLPVVSEAKEAATEAGVFLSGEMGLTQEGTFTGKLHEAQEPIPVDIPEAPVAEVKAEIKNAKDDLPCDPNHLLEAILELSNDAKDAAALLGVDEARERPLDASGFPAALCSTVDALEARRLGEDATLGLNGLDTETDTPDLLSPSAPLLDGAVKDDVVAESGGEGEDSEDEWNYFKGEPKQEDDRTMNSPLNPDAAEFVPGSPTPLDGGEMNRTPLKSVPHGLDDIVSSSPNWANMDSVKLPDEAAFLEEAKTRPNNVLDGIEPLILREEEFGDDVEEHEEPKGLALASDMTSSFIDPSTMSDKASDLSRQELEFIVQQNEPPVVAEEICLNVNAPEFKSETPSHVPDLLSPLSPNAEPSPVSTPKSTHVEAPTSPVSEPIVFEPVATLVEKTELQRGDIQDVPVLQLAPQIPQDIAELVAPTSAVAVEPPKTETVLSEPSEPSPAAEVPVVAAAVTAAVAGTVAAATVAANKEEKKAGTAKKPPTKTAPAAKTPPTSAAPKTMGSVKKIPLSSATATSKTTTAAAVKTSSTAPITKTTARTPLAAKPPVRAATTPTATAAKATPKPKPAVSSAASAKTTTTATRTTAAPRVATATAKPPVTGPRVAPVTVAPPKPKPRVPSAPVEKKPAVNGEVKPSAKPPSTTLAAKKSPTPATATTRAAPAPRPATAPPRVGTLKTTTSASVTRTTMSSAAKKPTTTTTTTNNRTITNVAAKKTTPVDKQSKELTNKLVSKQTAASKTNGVANGKIGVTKKAQESKTESKADKTNVDVIPVVNGNGTAVPAE